MAAFKSSILSGVPRHLALVDLADYELAYYTRKNPERPSQNEDCLGFAVLPNQTVVLMVADGVGGHPKGAEAAYTVLSSIEKNLRKLADIPGGDDEVRTAILNGIEKANQLLIHEAIGSRSTVTVCVVKKQGARAFQVGDSELMICGQRGRIKYQTWSHSPVGYAVQAGILDSQAAMTHPDRHFISNVVGEAEMRIEMGPTVELAPRDTILLGSDGLYDNFSYGDLSNFVRSGPMTHVLDNLVHKLEGRLTPGDDRPESVKFDDVSFMTLRRLAI